MSKNLLIRHIILLFGSFLLIAGLPEARAGSTMEEVLDILHSRGDITEVKYEELKDMARKEDRGLETYFDNNLHINSGDGRFKFQIGGRILIDMVSIEGDEGFEKAEAASGETFEGTGVEFRQARLYMQGLLYDQVAFKNEFDFAGGEVNFMENWIGFPDLPYLGQVRIGHTKEPFSLERLNSRKYMPFMERALPDGIVPGRNTGIRFLNFLDSPRLSWSVGFFKETGGHGDEFTESGDYNITGRLTVTPWYVDNGCRLLHLGGSYSHKFANEDVEKERLRFSKAPELHISDLKVLDTGYIKAEEADMVGLEAALVFGPLCLQGEYWYTRLDSNKHDNPCFKGYYLTSSYFLTGEHRKYKTRGDDGAEFSLVDIKSPFNPGKGSWGAWQVAARYSEVDLNDQGIQGGEMDDITLALNWYPYTNVRWCFNYIHADVEDSYAGKANIADAEANAYQMRFQIYF
ncbi:MAG: porin [Desulfobia sp.]